MSMRISPNEMRVIAERITKDVKVMMEAISSLDSLTGMIIDCGIEPDSISCIKEYEQCVETLKEVLPNMVSQVYDVIQELERQRVMAAVYAPPQDDTWEIKSDCEYPENYIE